MDEIDIFLDLEGLGVVSPPFKDGARVNTLLDQLPLSLEEFGYRIREIWGTACVRPNRQRTLPGYVQITIKQVLIRHGGVMCWTEGIADEALNREVQRRLGEGSLAQTVLLVASDHDFVPLVRELTDSGRSVIISGHQVSERLAAVATRTIPLSELLGEDREFVRTEPDSPFNVIKIPSLP